MNSNSETRSGFQPYRPEENRTSLSAQSTVPPPNPYGLDPTAAAAYSPYHAAAAAAAAAAAFYPPHLQHAYRYFQKLSQIWTYKIFLFVQMKQHLKIFNFQEINIKIFQTVFHLSVQKLNYQNIFCIFEKILLVVFIMVWCVRYDF